MSAATIATVAGFYLIATSALVVGWQNRKSAQRNSRRERMLGVRRRILVDLAPRATLQPSGCGACPAGTYAHANGADCVTLDNKAALDEIVLLAQAHLPLYEKKDAEALREAIDLPTYPRVLAAYRRSLELQIRNIEFGEFAEPPTESPTRRKTRS